MVTPGQIRAGRGLLGWSQAELGRRSGLSANAVSLIETGASDAKTSTMTAIVRALESGGVEFLNGGHPGVRLR
jgi:predicted transcriptional regulator